LPLGHANDAAQVSDAPDGTGAAAEETAAVVDAAGIDDGAGAGDGGGSPAAPVPDAEQTQPGLTIMEGTEQIGYPREVVPGAELVKRVSSGEGPQLPHWADPPTGEVPRSLAGAKGADDELQAWRLLGSRGLRWREDVNDWSDGPGVEDLVDTDEEPGRPREAPAGNPFSFDEDFERLERERAGRAGPAASDATVEIASEAGTGITGGQGAGDGGGRGEAPPVPAGSPPGQGPASAAGGEGQGQPPVVAEPGAQPGRGTGSEGEAGAGVLPFLAGALGEGSGAAGTAAAGPGGVVGGTGEGGGVPNAGPPGPSPSGGGGEMADRTATRTSGSGQTGLRRSGRGAVSRRTPQADANAAAARHSRAPYDIGAEAGGAGRNVGAAVGTGLVLAGLFIICYLIGPAALVGLATLAIAGCALEAFAMFQRAGFRPATLVGALGSGGAVLAAYWKGTAALPEVLVVVFLASLVWYLGRVVDARPVVNVAVTVFGFAWVGVLGSFAAVLLQAHQGTHLFLGAVVPTVVADMAAWFVGSQLGQHPLAPATSPSKTWEGFVGGGVAALVAGAVIGSQVSPWGGVRHGLELGLVVALMAPLGDLVQSMVKRDLRLKDSGALLPGHGGLLDRFDSLLFVLPATYFLVVVLHIVK
jgi:CDP-diglyceride synthetase